MSCPALIHLIALRDLGRQPAGVRDRQEHVVFAVPEQHRNLEASRSKPQGAQNASESSIQPSAESRSASAKDWASKARIPISATPGGPIPASPAGDRRHELAGLALIWAAVWIGARSAARARWPRPCTRAR